MNVLLFDLETTGTNPEEARIIQFSFHMIPFSEGNLDYEAEGYYTKTALVNPKMTIPVDTVAVHGITDEMVADKPGFSTYAPELLEWIHQADAIGGYNNRTYDNVILEYEMGRAGIELSLRDKPCLDVFKMIKHYYNTSGSLGGMVKILLDIDMDDRAHDADYDTHCTGLLLHEVLKRNGGIAIEDVNPTFFGDELDLGGKLSYNEEGEVVFNFGKYEYKRTGKTLIDVVAIDAGYLEWMYKQDFPADFKGIISAALAGKVPRK